MKDKDLQLGPEGVLKDWLVQQSQQDLLRFITCGSVDDGKSTLIGRLLWESQQVFEDQVNALEVESKRYGTQGEGIDFALLVDGLVAEREQGITIDVAYRFFATPKRKFIVADTPGHEQYTRNMITGASTADVAVLLVDARYGILTQTRRHAFLASLVGISHIVVAINKMDLVEFSQKIFNQIVSDLHKVIKSLNFQSVEVIPVSALLGDNIVHLSLNMPWYSGKSLIGYLENLEIRHTTQTQMIFPVQWVNRPNADFRGFSGTVAAGRLDVGDMLRVTSSGQTAILNRIVTAGGDMMHAQEGDAVTLVLNQEIDISRGDILSLVDKPLEMTEQFEATIVWMHDDKGLIGRSYELKLATQWASASITNLKYCINVNTQARESCKQLALNDIAVVNIMLSKPLAYTSYANNHVLGGFILVDKFTHATVAAGMIHHSLRRAQNVHRQALSICRQDRERLNAHKGKVIWFTGLSGSGKSTLANALEKELYQQGKRTFILDGDNIRHGLNKDLGFTDADRVENIRRVAEVAKLMLDAGLIVITAFISPFRAEREMARELIGAENFVEIFVDTSLDVCEQRDPKGLYKKAREGKIPNMTGMNSPYESPLTPDLVIDTDRVSIEFAVKEILSFVDF